VTRKKYFVFAVNRT